MNREKLMDAIGLLPGDLLAETDRLRTAPRKGPVLQRWLALAACFVLVVTAGLFVLRMGMGGSAEKQAAEAPREMALQEPAAQAPVTGNSVTADAAPKAENGKMEETTPDTHPLTLTAGWSGGEVRAEAGSYTLRETMDDGSCSETIACGAHPLQQRAEPTEVDDAALWLHWQVMPDSITVRAWPADAGVDNPGTGLAVTEGRLTLLPEYQIYEITARWGDACTASYVLHLDLRTP